MILSKSVAELQRERVVLELECIDRMYLNAYVPQLTSEAGVAGFVRGYLGHRFASNKAVAQMTESFVESIMEFGLNHQIDLVRFKKGQRKDDMKHWTTGSRGVRTCQLHSASATVST